MTTAVSARDATLDYLRGGAALAVVCFHYFYKGPAEGWMQAERIPVVADIAAYGYLGVHLFFMISGYVIMMTAQQSGLRHFAASRVSRLVPAFWVGMLLTVLVEWAIPQAPFHLESVWQWLANLTLAPSWWGQSAIDGSYWSLAIEINFYLWVALVIALGQLRHIEFLLLMWLGISLVNVIRPMNAVQVFLIAQWAPLFAGGAFFFLVRQSGWTRRRRVALVLSCVLACGYAFREYGKLPEPGTWFSLARGPNLFLVIGLILAYFGVFWWLSTANRASEPTAASDLMGRLTYPLYLVHQNMGYALFNAALALGWVGAVGGAGVTLGLVLLSLLAAWIINVSVERTCGPALRRLIMGPRKGGHGQDAAAVSVQTPSGGR